MTIRKIFAVLCACWLQSAAAQNMVVVNNTPGIVADYKTLQGAVDSVANGTLILLQPGPYSYGMVTIKKRVSIIGAGYFLNHNPDPTSQATPAESVVTNISFDTASDGSYITGLSLTGINPSGARINFLNTSNVTVSCCLVYPASGLFYAYKANLITVKQSYIKNIPGYGNISILNSREANNLQFFNNVFENEPAYGFQMPTEYFTNFSTQVLFRNNVLYNLFTPGYYPSACTMINNIVIQYGGFTYPVTTVAAMNNVGNVTYTSPGTNITNAVEANVFVLNSDPSVGSLDARFKLKAGSPAIGYGQGGVDCGIFGGQPNERYELSGIAEFVPNIYYLNVPTVGTTTGGLPVHIKVRANQ